MTPVVDLQERAGTCEGTITSIHPLRDRSVRVMVNRRMRVVVPQGMSEFFAGARVRISGVWRVDSRRRYLLASTIKPLESTADMGVERLARRLLGVPSVDGDRQTVLELLAPALTWLLSSGFPSLARRLAQYPIRRAWTVLHNPYALVRRRELDFDAADMLYRRLHGDPLALHRLQAGTTEVLRQAERQGRARLSAAELSAAVTARLNLSTDYEVDWSQVWRSSIVARDDERYCLPSWYFQRRRALQILQSNQVPLGFPEVQAAGALLHHRYVVLTGSARSGKTVSIRALASACRASGWRVAVTAMTGKAASVIGPEAGTLHRLLGYGPHGYQKTPLPFDLLIIDEASMLTWPLLAAALALMPGHIVFSGDPRQLPPVEGEPAFPELLQLLPVHDLGVVPSVEVTTVRHWSIEHLLSNLSTMARTCVAAGRECQVLSPIRHSRLGTVQLNTYLQGIMNPAGAVVAGHLRQGDRVIVVRNDYAGERPVYNGEMGRVSAIGTRGVVVELDRGHQADVPLGDLELAYCLTVHKSQGSRFDTVVFVIPPMAKAFAEEDRMRYVGFTRGRTETWCYAL